jgi:2-polyprenyl-3-methyl-5-hydroxy-6-metoxy-1,4-benzoquinol methylase
MQCPICKSKDLKIIYESTLPYSSAILSYIENEKLNKGVLRLTECQGCQFVFNQNFDVESINRYYASENYVIKNILPGEMSKNVSFIFNEIIKRVPDKGVAIEIGSGRGDFAFNLSTVFKKVYTIDPSVYSPEYSKDNIEHFNTFFDGGLLNKIEKPNLIVARHLLEHLQNPSSFIKEIDKFIRDQNCLVYIEIPNFNEIVGSARFYDLFYDHFGYFYQDVFRELLEKYDLNIVDKIEIFNSQHVGFFCKKNEKNENLTTNNRIQKHYLFDSRKIELNNFLKLYDGFIIWGAGVHGLTLFFSLNKINQNKVLCFIDNDSFKQNKYIPGTSIKIINDKIINDKKEVVILISASLYEDEITKHILDINNNAIIIKPTQNAYIERFNRTARNE